MLHVVVLGAAAGGGFPQWNCNDKASIRARAGDKLVPAQTQSSIAVSADGVRWTIVNASPDLRHQIDARRVLHPAADGPKRSSPIRSIVLTNADVDHVAGLLSLRESQAFSVYAHPRVLSVLARNSIFNVLDPRFVDRRPLPVDSATVLADRDGTSLDLTVRAFAVPGKVALWLEDPDAPGFGTEEGDTIGIEIRAGDGQSLFYVPNCAAFTDDLARRLRGAEAVLFDGTLWRDDEMIRAGVGVKTGGRMGHMSCSGRDGVIAAFADLGVRRKLFIHINNTNPLLIADSSERAEARRAGWDVAFDGMEIML